MPRPTDPSAAARDFLAGIAEATADDRRALAAATKIKLGRGRVARIQILLGRAITSEQLARRPVSIGEPFRLHPPASRDDQPPPDLESQLRESIPSSKRALGDLETSG